MMNEANEKMYNVVFCQKPNEITERRLCRVTDIERTIQKGEYVLIREDTITNRSYIGECLTDSELVNENVLKMLGGDGLIPEIIGTFELKPIDNENASEQIKP